MYKKYKFRHTFAPDFVVRHDLKNGDPEEFADKIFYSLIVKEIKAKKVVRMFIGGASGTGKSMTAAKVTERLLRIQGLDPVKYADVCNIYQPLEFPTKFKKILFDKEYKKVNVLVIHEARDLIKSSRWNDFLAQAIADINTQSRAVKNIILIIISQMARDVTKEMRLSFTHYGKVKRRRGEKARLYLEKVIEDDRDIEKPYIFKTKIKGFVIDEKTGRYKCYVPQYFLMSLPSKEYMNTIIDQDKKAKGDIISKKLDNLLKEMQKDLGVEKNRIPSMVEWYTKEPERLKNIGHQTKAGNWKLNKEFIEMNDFTPSEKKDFIAKLKIATQEKTFFSKDDDFSEENIEDGNK